MAMMIGAYACGGFSVCSVADLYCQEPLRQMYMCTPMQPALSGCQPQHVRAARLGFGVCGIAS